jgi:hypothetical protein
VALLFLEAVQKSIYQLIGSVMLFTNTLLVPNVVVATSAGLPDGTNAQPPDELGLKYSLASVLNCNTNGE